MKKKHLRAMALAMAALMSLTACGGWSSGYYSGRHNCSSCGRSQCYLQRDITYRSFPAGSISGSSQKQYSDRTSDVRWNRV